MNTNRQKTYHLGADASIDVSMRFLELLDTGTRADLTDARDYLKRIAGDMSQPASMRKHCGPIISVINKQVREYKHAS